MKERKRCLAPSTWYDPEPVERRLEEMAARGWALEKLGKYVWTFRRAKPQTVRYAVTYCPEGSAFDAAPTERQARKEDFLAADGWRVAARQGVLVLLRSENPDAVPPDTEPVVQAETVWQAVKRTELRPMALVAVLILAGLWDRLRELFQQAGHFLSSAGSLYGLAAWLLLCLASAWHLAYLFRWRRKSRRMAEQGVYLPLRQSAVLWALLALAVCFLMRSAAELTSGAPALMIWAAGAAVTVAAIRLAVERGKRNGASRAVNRRTAVLLSLAGAIVVTALVTAVIVLARDGSPAGTYQLHGQTWDYYMEKPRCLAASGLSHW